MKQQLKYVNFYKRTLLKGCLHGFAADETLALRMEQPDMTCAYITPFFNTNDNDMTFNRLCVEGSFEGAKLEIIVATSNETDAFIDDKLVSLKQYFACAEISPRKKAEVMIHLPHVRAVNTQDILLHSLTGQYVWVYVGVTPSGACDCSLNGIRLEFPKYSFTEYFPEIYQQDEFFDRYIAVFQSMYLDEERKIDEVPRLLDYKSTTDKNVEVLAGWIGIDNSEKLFSTEQLRYLIENNDLFQGGKGTRVTLEEIIVLGTGIRPRIVEFFQWNCLPMSEARCKLNKDLYGETSNHFCVILDLSSKKNSLPIRKEELEKLVENYSMIGTRHKLVYLYRNSHTDSHCYLDVNSYLSTPEIAEVDNVTLGSHIIVG